MSRVSSIIRQWVVGIMVCSSVVHARTIKWCDTPQITDVVADQENVVVELKGTNSIKGPVCFRALNADIIVHPVISDEKVVLQGCAGNASRLYLVAEKNRTITFLLDETDLTLQGGVQCSPLFIAVAGQGEVRFCLKGGRTVLFDSDNTIGGVKLYVDMRVDGGSTLRFKRVDPANDLLDKDVTIVLGKKSLISFMGSQTVYNGDDECVASVSEGQQARIIFDPTNDCLSRFKKGRMVLRITEGGGLIVAGHYCGDVVKPVLTLDHIDRTRVAGHKAVVQVINSGTGPFAYAGLLVLNDNEKESEYMIDPWCTNSFLGRRKGCIIGATGVLLIDDNAYVDYVSLARNRCFSPKIDPALLKKRSLESVLKERNPSALGIDGVADSFVPPATIQFGTKSALFVRSGVADNGTIREKDVDGYSLVINPLTPRGYLPLSVGCGQLVMAVEGPLLCQGSNTDLKRNSKLEILSLQVAPCGGPLFNDSAETIFPKRTFAVDDDGDPLRYNSACVLINNRMILQNMTLVHSDENHRVIENNDEISEPTYVGGETYWLKKGNGTKPSLSLVNSQVQFQTSAACVGFDLLVPSAAMGNSSVWTFFYNGRKVDNGFGRSVILGTRFGSFACDGRTSISRESSLFIQQTGEQQSASAHELRFTVAPNSSMINNAITGPIDGQYSVATVYLGHTSSLIVGTKQASFPLLTKPQLVVDGNYFSCATRGGSLGVPESSVATGQGALFVYDTGNITVTEPHQAHFATMVVRGHGGTVDLPKNRVLFDNGVGITDACVDLNDPIQRVLVDPSECLSDYTINWPLLIKDCQEFEPFVCGTSVTQANVSGLPQIQGTVYQLQIRGARLGDVPHCCIDGGVVKELIFQPSFLSAQAAVSVMVLKNGGTLGIGSVHRSIDSAGGTTVLGINGVTLIADGNGQVTFNQDCTIDTVCPLVAGPNFGVDEEQTVVLHADCCRTLTVKSSGVLDLSSFNTRQKRIVVSGALQVVFEPGSRLILNGGQLIFTDQTALRVMGNQGNIHNNRVAVVGEGLLLFDDQSSLIIEKNALLSVETDPAYTATTALELQLIAQAQVLVGRVRGGSLQVGNTIEQPGASVSLSVTVNGDKAGIVVASNSFLGLGVGIVDRSSLVPNEWVVQQLSNVASIMINIQAGDFVHNSIAAGSSETAALVALGSAAQFRFVFDPVQASILGGGNIALITASGFTNPTVLSSATATASILSSKDLLVDTFVPTGPYNTTNPGVTTAAGLFTYLQVIDAATLPTPTFENSPFEFTTDYIKATVGPLGNNRVMLGYVDQGFIVRQDTSTIFGFEAQSMALTINEVHSSDLMRSVSKGAVSVFLAPGTTPRLAEFVVELP